MFGYSIHVVLAGDVLEGLPEVDEDHAVLLGCLGVVKNSVESMNDSFDSVFDTYT